MSHYDALGIKPDATADEVKRAYRACSSKAHPDKGGSDEEMAKINRAYDVLSSPDRRASYDAGGDDSEPVSLAERARGLLADLIDNCLSNSAQNIVVACHQRIDEAMDEAKRGKRVAEAKVKVMTKRRKTISKQGEGENLVHAVIDKKIAEASAKLVQLDQVIELFTEVRVQLKDYNYTPDPADASAPGHSAAVSMDSLMNDTFGRFGAFGKFRNRDARFDL